MWIGWQRRLTGVFIIFCCFLSQSGRTMKMLIFFLLLFGLCICFLSFPYRSSRYFFLCALCSFCFGHSCVNVCLLKICSSITWIRLRIDILLRDATKNLFLSLFLLRLYSLHRYILKCDCWSFTSFFFYFRKKKY